MTSVDVWFGIDVGGTSVKSGLIDSCGRVQAQLSFDTGESRSPERIAEKLAAVLEDLKRQVFQQSGMTCQVHGAGVGIPGFLDLEQGLVVEAVNLGWMNAPIRRLLEDYLHLPVVMENDANLAALGEAFAGAGAGHQVVLCATVGTGVGGGIVIGGTLHRGVNGMAGEIGHLVVDRSAKFMCNCGHYGCLETVASATAMVRHGRDRQERGLLPRDTVIHEARDVFALADAGHDAAKAVIAEAADWLGYGLALVATTLNPDVIVIGGGVSKAEERFLTPMRATFQQYALERVALAAEIRAATLSNDAGMIGAARLAQQQTG